MNSLRAQASAAIAICRRDFLLFTSYRMRFVSTFLATFVTITVFFYVSRLVHSDRVGSPASYFGFVVVGIVILEVLTSTLVIPVTTLRQELVAGTFERLILSPAGALRCIVSLLLFPLLLAFVLGIATLIYAAVAFGLSVRWPTVAAAIPVGFLGALAFAPFGLIMTSAVVRFKQTSAGATFVITAVTLLAGIYFPVTLLPGWIQWASDVQPFTPAVDLLRHLMVGTALRDSAALSLFKLVAFPAVLLPASLALLGASLRSSRRAGTIIEY